MLDVLSHGMGAISTVELQEHALRLLLLSSFDRRFNLSDVVFALEHV